MIFFDGIYRLKPPNTTVPTPRKEWDHSWRVRIINFELGQSDIQFIRPVVVFVSPNGDRPLKISCAEGLGKRICRDFQLDVEDILWIENIPSDSEPLKAATFRFRSDMGPYRFYRVSWRSLRPNERSALAAFIPEIPDISC